MTHFFADDGAKIHLQISGEGCPLLLLHGWTANHQEWLPFLEQLNRHHKVYRWDARGHGGHDAGNQFPPTVQRMARDLANLIEHFKLDQVAAVGHSMGALTLWQYIRDFGTKHLQRLCVIDQSPKLVTDENWHLGIYGDFDSAKAARFIEALKQDFAESVLKLAAFGLNPRATQKYLDAASGWERSRVDLRAQAPSPLIECWSSLTNADYRDVLEAIDIPSLLIFGGQSNFYHVETAHYVASRIPNAILQIYEGADHSPHQWQRERFAEELMAFINT